jgi:type II secretory ATPase GspE/PulE/Tfp pilus assembly ATPase PilB-like protein
MGLFGKKKQQADLDAPPPVELVPKGGATPRDDQANLLMAKQSPGFLFAQRMLFDAIKRRAENILLDYTAQAVAVRYQLDGVWMNSATLDRATGDAMLAVLKVISALNMNERRAMQKGVFGCDYKKRKFECRLISQGVPTGERVTIRFEEPKAARLQKIEELGFREGMLEQIKTLFTVHDGFILVSAPPGHGLSTTFSTLLRSADRFVRNFAEVQDASNPERPVENVPITKYDSAKEESPLTVMPKLLRTYPDVLCLRNLVNAEVMDLLLDQVPQERLVVGAIPAKDCCEAILRVLALKVPPERFAPTLRGVLNVRLVRVLCEACKVAYPPPPQVLQQLGIPQGKVAAFYRNWEGPLPPQNEKDEPRMCPKCNGLGFRGRIGVFELLIPNEEFLQTLAKTPRLDVLRVAARKCGMRSLQEEGIVLVARGVTSLPELLRVLKE